MNTALENSVTFHTRRVGGEVQESLPLTGAVLHAVGSRAEAVRLVSVAAGLRARGIAQVVACPIDADLAAGDFFDLDDVPRTEALVERLRHSDVRRTANALAAAERALVEHEPSMVVLAGDTDSSLAFALAASKLGLPIARLGAGLRSGDASESDEINRVMSDRLANVLFTDGHDAADTLDMEGIGDARVVRAGNSAVDLLRRVEPLASEAAVWRRFGVQRGGYLLATLHREENVCDRRRLGRITTALSELARRMPVLLPVHPAMRGQLDTDALRAAGVLVTEPLTYVDFLSMALGAGAILTDSGSVQDEASALGVRCYALQRGTDRVVSLMHGTSVLLGDDPAEILEIRLDEMPPLASAIPLWDGRAGDRIAAELVRRANLNTVSS